MQQQKPALVVLDVVMPKIDGLEVCRRLKRDPQTRHIPVLILTASGIRSPEEAAKEAGADAWMRKPYDSKELIETVKRLVAGSQPPR